MKKIIKFLFLLSFIATSLIAKNLEKVSVQLQWLDQFQFAGYYVAKEKGFYENVGLDVTIKKHSPDINIVQEVISKRATFGIGHSSLIQEKSRGADIVLLSAIFQSSPSVIIARKDSDIKKIQDFKGKKIMTFPELSSDVSVLAMEYKYGIKPSDMIEEKHSYDVNDLIQKHTDLMVAYISNEPFLMKKKGYGVKIFDPKDYGFDFYSDILFTSTDEVKNHTQRVVNFKNATLKGWEYAFTHIDEAVEIILQKYNTQHKSKEALVYEAKELRKLAYYRTQNLGVIDWYKIQSTYDIYNVLHLLKNPIDLDTFIFHMDKNKIILTHKEKEYLNKKKTLSVCVNKNRLPYEAVANGKFIGISADFLKFYAKKISIPIKIITVNDQREMLKLLHNQTCDIKPIFATFKQINIPYTSTKAIFSDSISLVTRIEQPFIYNLDFLDSKKILVLKGFKRLIKYLRDGYPNLLIKEIQDKNKAFEMVKNKKAFGFIGTSLVSSRAIQQKYSTELKIVNSFKIFNISLGVNKSEPLLLDILNKAITKTTQTKKNQILNRWISTVVEKSIDYSYAWKITVIFLIILLAIMYFYHKQKKLKDKLKLLNNTLEKRVKKEVQNNKLQYQQMLNQSRLAQMGEMISMIAHQWRQPLAAISATTSNLKFKIVVDDVDKDVFNKEIGLIEDYSLHLSNTIDDFRGFFKDGKTKELTTLEDIVLGTLKIAQPAVENKNIEIRTQFKCNKPLKLYPNEIKQVVLNLIKNAEDVLIEKDVKNPQIVIETLYENNQKILRVKDNGGGVPEKILEKIFDPYFSTKKEKDGTGLGLYMSKTIVQEHCKGSLHVNNDEHGAIFTIVLN